VVRVYASLVGYPEAKIGVAASAATESYRLAGTGRTLAEDERLSLLEEIFDPVSIRRRSVVQVGWWCLEVGAGRGSMAVWLAERVGPNGRVVATDIDVTYLERLEVPNLEVRRHNILDDPLELLEPGSFDVVCSRLMLFHLVGRQEEAIRRMALCLKPGGLLIDEDADWGTTAPVDRSHPRFAAFHRAWRDGDWWATRGYDPTFGRTLPALFERSGLASVHHEATSEVVRGGSPWARWYRDSLDVIAEATPAQTAERRDEHEIITSALADPSVWFLRELLHAGWGRRPV
jgi:SAM-dependent methyltransferase